MLTDRAVTGTRLARALASIIGRRHVTLEGDRLVAARGAAPEPSVPLVVARPATTAEVAEVLRFAGREHIPVFPHSDTVNAAARADGERRGIVLELTRLAAVQEIDEGDLFAAVEPAVTVRSLRQELESRRLFYPPAPAVDDTPVGAAVARGIVGVRACKYGVTRDYVQALEVVLAGGEVVRTGPKVLHAAGGYDLTRLLVGSCGTLGVVTRAALRLLPAPECTRTVALYFPSAAAAAGMAHAAASRFPVPAVIELLDAAALGYACASCGASPPAQRHALLLVEVDGTEDGSLREAEALQALGREHGARDTCVAATVDESQRLWAPRRAAAMSLEATGLHVLHVEVAVPPAATPALLARVAAIGKETGVTPAVHGHAGCGRLHVDLIHSEGPRSTESGRRAVAEIARAAAAQGGTAWGEGAAAGLLPPSLPPAVLGLARRIKRLLDPQGILNPGRLFADAGAVVPVGDESAPRGRA